MDLFSHSDFSINRHFQRSIRIDNEISKEFLEHFIFHDTGKKVFNQIANSLMKNGVKQMFHAIINEDDIQFFFSIPNLDIFWCC